MYYFKLPAMCARMLLATVHAMFKPVEEYPDYAVNEEGVVMSYKQSSKGKILKGEIHRKGYIVVTLCKPGQRPKAKRVHRLVAEAFIPNPNNLPFINHIDENKTNNQVSNLEWCNSQYNIEYSKSKYYLVEHISSGDTFTVFNLQKWCRDNNITYPNLQATLTGAHRCKTTKGYRVLSVSEHPDDSVT